MLGKNERSVAVRVNKNDGGDAELLQNLRKWGQHVNLCRKKLAGMVGEAIFAGGLPIGGLLKR